MRLRWRLRTSILPWRHDLRPKLRPERMIGRIQGQLLELTDSQVLLDVGGIGYEVEITAATLSALPGSEGSVIGLYTHFVVREDAQVLYGFSSRLERDVFRDLIRISGVGPKLAQNLIGGISLEELAHCVQHNDVAMLTRVPGVGKKTAERLLVELKDRLGSFSSTETVRAAGPGAISEAEDALLALGYRPAEAQRAIAAARVAAAPDAGAEALIRVALQALARQSEVMG